MDSNCTSVVFSEPFDPGSEHRPARHPVEYMDRLRAIVLSERHEHAIHDGFILAYALAPDITRTILPARTALLDDAEYVAVLLGYDDAMDWNPDDPRLEQLADSAARLAQRMTLVSDLPDFDTVPHETIDILTRHQGIDSPAWERLDRLMTKRFTTSAKAQGTLRSPASGEARGEREQVCPGATPLPSALSCWEFANPKMDR